MRITKGHLLRQVERINRVYGFKLEPYTKLSSGKYEPNPNVFHLSWAYGGVSLHQMCEDGTGIKDVFSCGHVSKRELYNRITAFAEGSLMGVGRTIGTGLGRIYK